MIDFLRSKAGYANALQLIESEIRTDRHLPDQVFSKRKEKISFISADLVLTADFWQYLRVLNESHSEGGRSSVTMCLLDQYFDECFFSKFGFFAAVELPPETSQKDYVEVLARPFAKSSDDCLAVSGSRFVFVPKTGAWAVWADRRAEICIASHRSIDAKILGCDWTSQCDQALSWFVAPAFPNGNIPDRYKFQFASNYTSQL